MKKILSLAVATVMLAGFVSCGPSDEEKKADSLYVDSQHKEMKSTEDHMIDSINKAMEAMSMGDTMEKHRQDSLRADSMKKAGGKKK